MTDFAIVIPTVGRDSLQRLLAELDGSSGPKPSAVLVADDRADPTPPLQLSANLPVTVLRSGGRGPAAGGTGRPHPLQTGAGDRPGGRRARRDRADGPGGSPGRAGVRGRATMRVRSGVLGLLVLVSVITFLDRIAISVAGPSMQDELGISPERWGWVISAFKSRRGNNLSAAFSLRCASQRGVSSGFTPAAWELMIRTRL